jgi:hypothetical protein
MMVVDVVGGNGPAAGRADDVQATAAVAALARLQHAVTAPGDPGRATAFRVAHVWLVDLVSGRSQASTANHRLALRSIDRLRAAD